MNKDLYLNEINKRLPEDLIIEDETPFEFTEDEFIGILSWIKYFNLHYKEKGKTDIPEIVFPIISKRLRLDFGLYSTPNDTDVNKGKYIIYITANGRMLNGAIKQQSIQQVINTWNL